MGAPMVGNFIRECGKLDFKPQFATGPSGVDNDVALIAGKASYGTIGSSSTQPWTSEVAGAYKMRAITDRLRPNMKPEDKGMFYIYYGGADTVICGGRLYKKDLPMCY